MANFRDAMVKKLLIWPCEQCEEFLDSCSRVDKCISTYIYVLSAESDGDSNLSQKHN